MLAVLLLAGPAFAGAGGPCGTGGPHPIPEPAELALLGVGIGGLLTLRAKRGKKK